MKRVLKNTAIALAGIALVQAGVRAESVPPAPPRGPIPFELMDTDRDGRVSAGEFTQAHQQRLARRAQQGYPMRGAGRHPAFQTVDLDRDGVLSADELAAFRTARRAGRPCPRRQGL